MKWGKGFEMTGSTFLISLILINTFHFSACTTNEMTATTIMLDNSTIAASQSKLGDLLPNTPYTVTTSTKEYRDFSVDNVLHSDSYGDIHFNVYIPDDYDGSEAYAVYFTLPGYQGLYFQGVAQNIKTENFGFEAQNYNSKMIVVAPQLSDWGETSANQTIELVEYILQKYNIDTNKVYISGYSGGGETLSLVMAKRAELFSACLMCSSQWDGEFDAVVNSKTPIYFVIGESDEYYGCAPFESAYNTVYSLYAEQGLSDEEIDHLLVLDVKSNEYFSSRNKTNQHAQGAAVFASDKNVMGWLFQ